LQENIFATRPGRAWFSVRRSVPRPQSASISNEASGLIVDVGTKAKLVTADKSNDLLTTGKNDYSLLVDAQYPFGDTTLFATVGWTKKGDPVSEATVFVERKFADSYKLQAYVVRGFSDASPDLGAGLTLSKRF